MIKRLIIILLFSLNAYCADQQKIQETHSEQLEMIKPTFSQIHAEISALVVCLCEYILQHKEINFDSKAVIDTIYTVVYKKYFHLVEGQIQSQLCDVLCNLTSLYMDIFYKVERMFSDDFPKEDDAINAINLHIESLINKDIHALIQQSLKAFAKQEVERRVINSIAEIENN